MILEIKVDDILKILSALTAMPFSILFLISITVIIVTYIYKKG